MTTHDDPSNDEYRELDKKVAAAEDDLLVELAETDHALDTAVKKGKKRAEAAGAQLEREVEAHSPKHH